MNIRHGKGRTKYGPGVDILLTGNELAQAVLDYIAARGVDVTGPRTVTGRGPTQQKAEDR